MRKTRTYITLTLINVITKVSQQTFPTKMATCIIHRYMFKKVEIKSISQLTIRFYVSFSFLCMFESIESQR